MRPLLFLFVCVSAPFVKAEETLPLPLAVELALAIEGDEDTAAARQLEVVKLLLKRRELTLAISLAEKIVDYRSGVALALCAESSKDADLLLAQAEKKIGRASPSGANAIRRDLAVAFQSHHKDADVARLIASISDKEIRTQARLLCEIVNLSPPDDLDLEKWRKEIKETVERAPFPGAIEAARRLSSAGLSLVKAGEATRGLRRLKEAEELAELALVAHAETLLPAAIELLVTKESRTAHRLMLRAASEVRHMPTSYDMKAVLSASLAWGWHLAGKTDGALSILEQGEVLVTELPPMDQPKALASLAAGWSRLGNVERSTQLFMRAAEIAGANANPRMRTIGALDVCLAHDAADLRIGCDLTKRLRKLGALP
ncbi:MAG: hypothetical protein JNJ83_21395 [Verrucomicrobiaceae bacterium]|nr:hypothetical protein [Verrucomicrobiaceae bacterium]